jgi:hypothetical protein
LVWPVSEEVLAVTIRPQSFRQFDVGGFVPVLLAQFCREENTRHI